MMDVFTQHDLDKQHEAEGTASEAVGVDWRDKPFFPGDEVIDMGGEVVLDDTFEIRDYLIEHLGGTPYTANEEE